MPMTIRPDAWERWLDPAVSGPEITRLMRPAAVGSFVGHPVSSTVNAVRNNGPALLDAVDMADDPQAGLF
jgi:putative SOS response-associated peptidase YedK